MPAFARAILIQESAEGGLSYKAKKRRVKSYDLTLRYVLRKFRSYALQFYERRVMPYEHDGNSYSVVSNIYGIDLLR